MTRTQFLSRLRCYARRQGLYLAIEEDRGKGSHITVTLGSLFTIVKSGELKPGYVRVVLKQLGLPRDAI